MNAIDLKDRHAVVTGGAQGIGYSVAHRLLLSGASVSIWDMDAKLAQAAFQVAYQSLVDESERVKSENQWPEPVMFNADSLTFNAPPPPTPAPAPPTPHTAVPDAKK